MTVARYETNRAITRSPNLICQQPDPKLLLVALPNSNAKIGSFDGMSNAPSLIGEMDPAWWTEIGLSKTGAGVSRRKKASRVRESSGSLATWLKRNAEA